MGAVGALAVAMLGWVVYKKNKEQSNNL
jgi:hypothetical protein